MNIKKDYPQRTIFEAKKIVEIIGICLGNLIYEIYEGKILNDNWNENQKSTVKNTKYFIIGGSIGTKGFTKELIPLWARKRLDRLLPNDGNIMILPAGMDSFKAGSLGASYAFVNNEISKKIKDTATEISKTKIPIIPLIDIGGTKISFVLAHFDENGELNNKILESHAFPTPILKTHDQFYKEIVSFIFPILKRYEDSYYEIIKIIGIGQPGKFEHSQGIITEGAVDLGNLIGQCPSDLMSMAFNSYGSNEYSFYFCNDGTAQFYGLVKNIKNQNIELWHKLVRNKEKIMYLGIGTGLGVGHGIIENDELVINNIKDANGIKIKGELTEYLFDKYNVIKEIYSNLISQDKFEYGQIISSKLFHNYMHYIELTSIRSKNFFFLDSTGIKIDNPVYLSSFLKSELDKSIKNNQLDNKKPLSPLTAKLINEILEDEIMTAKSEVVFEIKEEELKNKLSSALTTFSREIKDSLSENLKSSSYTEVINEIIVTKKRGNIVHFVGIGKSHLIGKNLSYIYNNLGIRSSYLELTGANSENLTNLKQDDLVFFISNSGKACELLKILPYIKEKGCKTIAITGDGESYLKKGCDYLINTNANEKNPLSIKEAPTTSTTLALVAGTTIAIIVSFHFDYTKKDFYLDHPALEFDNSVKFKEVKSDTSFNLHKRIQDSLESFSTLIDKQKDYINSNGETFCNQILHLAKVILVSHYNNRTIFITGSGASYMVAEKVSATLTSIGIDAAIVNPAQLPHGDFAHIQKGDLLIVFSYSGNTKHLIKICEIAKNIKKAEVALITSNENAELAKNIAHIIVNINKTDDLKLVPIPDQKIMSSCINMVVGDALAIILEQVLQTSNEMFAIGGHPGGAISREEDLQNEILLRKYADLDDFFYKYFNNDALCKFEDDYNKAKCDNCDYKKNDYCRLQKEAIKLLDKHLNQINKAHYNYFDLLKIFKAELSSYNNSLGRSTNITGAVLVIGAGSIGTTYIARILNNYKKTLHFVEKKNERINNLISKRRRYTLTTDSENPNKSILIENFSITNSLDIPMISTYALTNNIVFVSIGKENHKDIINTIKFIVLRRYAYNINRPINFIFNENFDVTEKPLAELRYTLLESIDSPDVKIYFSENVGLVPAVDEVLAPIITDDFNFESPIVVEPNIAPLYISKKEWKGKSTDNEISECKEIHFVDDFYAYHMRKLWIHNMAHFLIAIQGREKKIKTICEATSDNEIRENVGKAIKLVGDQIYRRWDFSEFKTLDEYKDWLLNKYINKELSDTVDRVIRDPKRKLAKNDRLLGPLNYVCKYGKSEDLGCEEILKGICLAMKFRTDELMASWKKDKRKHNQNQETKKWNEIYQTVRNEIKNNLLIDTERMIKVEESIKKI